MAEASHAPVVGSEAHERRRTLGAAIKAARQPLTQSRLAQRLGGLAQATISGWESGSVELTCEQVRSIEVALGLPPGTLAMAAGYAAASKPVDPTPPRITEEGVHTQLRLLDGQGVETLAPPVVVTSVHGRGPCGFDCENEGQPILSIFLEDVEEALVAMRAADTLGLGIRVSNRLMHEDDETLIGGWVLDVLVEAPHVVE